MKLNEPRKKKIDKNGKFPPVNRGNTQFSSSFCRLFSFIYFYFLLFFNFLKSFHISDIRLISQL